MKKLLTVKNGEQFSLQTLFALVIGLALASTFWMATSPVAGAEMSPRQMIQSNLPQTRTLETAKKPELLAAVCASVKRWREAAPQIVKTASTAHKHWTHEIVLTAIRCLGTDDCDLIAEIVGVGIVDDPDHASNIIQSVIEIAPDCSGALDKLNSKNPEAPGEGPGGFGNAPTNQDPPPGSIGGGGGGFNPQQETVMVCNNGTEVSVNSSQLAAYLASHPGAFAGACVVTPATNK